MMPDRWAAARWRVVTTRRSAGGGWWSLVVTVTAGMVLLGCAGGSSQPPVVPLAELVDEQDAYDGSTVTAEGIVRSYEQPRHYWIEDAKQHRVELFPAELVEDLVGRHISVTGRFTFRDDRGRAIDVDELEVLAEPAASPVRSPHLSSSRSAVRRLSSAAGSIGAGGARMIRAARS